MRPPRRWDGGSPAGPRLSAGAEGRSPIPRPAWRTDHPSAGPGSDPLRQGRSRDRGFDARGLTPVPSTHVRGQGGRDAAKPVLRYPARHGGQAGQAPGGRRRRPSRAFFAPLAIRSWPTGASLDALLLPLTPGRCPPRGCLCWARESEISLLASGEIVDGEAVTLESAFHLVWIISQVEGRWWICGLSSPGTLGTPRDTSTNVSPAPRAPDRARAGTGRDPCTSKQARALSLCTAPSPRGRRGSHRSLH
jgi:hypothetical protein